MCLLDGSEYFPKKAEFDSNISTSTIWENLEFDVMNVAQ